MNGPARKIAALDIATVTGFAVGHVSEAPRAGSIRFGDIHREPADVFAAAVIWAEEFFARERPDMLIVEAMLPPTPALYNKTTRQVRDRLGGLHGIFLGLARKHGVGEIITVNVGDIRGHFIGDRALKRNDAKRAVMRQCRTIGWVVSDPDAADACAAFSYACAIIDPRSALRVSPLFNRGVAI